MCARVRGSSHWAGHGLARIWNLRSGQGFGTVSGFLGLEKVRRPVWNRLRRKRLGVSDDKRARIEEQSETPFQS